MPALTQEQLAKRKRTNGVILAVLAVCLLAMGGVYLFAHDEAPKSAPQAAPATAAATSPLTTVEATSPLTTAEVRAQVADLLRELDVFRNTSEFKECIYGCGKGNPGTVWDVKRKALQERMTPQLDVPVALKAAPGELWSLGMAYAKGKNEEAREIRAGIEKALAQ